MRKDIRFGKPDFKKVAEMRNKAAIYRDQLVTAGGEYARALKRERGEAQELADVLIRDMKDPHAKSLGSQFALLAKHGALPKTIVSEDASGRFLAGIFKKFLGLIGSKNVAVLSFSSSARDLSSVTEAILKNRATHVVEKIKTRDNLQRPFLYATDRISSGDSINPFLNALKDQGFLQARSSELRSQPIGLVVTSAAPSDLLSESQVQYLRKWPENIFRAVKFYNLQWPVQNARVYTGIARNERAARPVLNPLIVTETKWGARLRRKVQSSIAKGMAEAFLAREDAPDI